MNDSQTIEGRSPRLPTEEEIFYHAWGNEVVKSSFSLANDSLRQIVSLNVFLLGGSAFFLKEAAVHPTGLMFAMIAFALSLAVSFWSLIPSMGTICPNYVDDVKESMTAAMKSRIIRVNLSAFFLALGIVIVAVGIVATGNR